MHTFTSFGGTTFASLNWEVSTPDEEARGQWDVQARITERTGNTAVLSPGAIAPRRIVLDFVYRGTADLRLAVDQLLGALDPRDQNPRLLVGARYDTTVVQRYATVEMPSGTDADGSMNVVRVVFISEEPEWKKSTATTVDQTGSVSPFSLSETNEGQASVHPVYQVRWTVQRTVKGTVVGQQYRKRMTLTNTQERTIPPFSYQINLGDTAALVTATKAQADGDDLRVILNGEDMTRKLVGWNLAQSWAWIVVPGMDAGEVLTLDVVYGNANATNPLVWVDPDPTKPIIDLDWETGTATSGTATTLTKTSAGWEVNEWQGGRAWLLTGGNAGETAFVSSNTADTLTFTGSESPIHASGDTFLLEKSTNQIRTYAVRQTERETDYARGRWYLDSPKYTPNIVSYEAPDSWRPELIWDNRDSFGQARYSMLTTGAADKDPFSLLEVARLWEGNDPRVAQAGAADGVSLVTPMPITALYWEYQFDNPNGMCRAWAGVRGSGAEDWAEIFEDEIATSGLTTRMVGGGTVLLSGIQTNYGDVHQIAMALGPENEIEIDLDWRRDTGSATSGTTTVLTDSTKEWETDQFDNGKIRMLSGVNAGRARSVSASTGTTITHTAFPEANADGDRYVVTNNRLKGILRDGSKLVVHLDTTAITSSGLGAETAVYDASMTLWVGAGPAGDPAGQHRALIGYAGTQRRLFLAADERVEIDSDLRKIRIWNTTSSTYTATLTDPTVIVQWNSGTAWVRSANWLPMSIGAATFWLEEVNVGTLGLEVEYFASFLGA